MENMYVITFVYIFCRVFSLFFLFLFSISFRFFHCSNCMSAKYYARILMAFKKATRFARRAVLDCSVCFSHYSENCALNGHKLWAEFYYANRHGGWHALLLYYFFRLLRLYFRKGNKSESEYSRQYHTIRMQYQLHVIFKKYTHTPKNLFNSAFFP